MEKLGKAFQRSPLLTTRDLRAQGLPSKQTLRRRLGPWAECIEQAGRNSTALSKALFERMNRRKANGRELGIALAEKLRRDGHLVAFDGRLNVLDFTNLRVRLRLLWPTPGEVGQVRRIRIERISRDVDFDLLVRMEDLSRPKDFFVVAPADVVVRFPHWLIDLVPTELARYWCQSPQRLLERLRTLNERGHAALSDGS
ncbi:MAG TPA: hypothetical protein VFK10_07305, partial [Burkholderiaceae bacterium]|nr:hypothetical protein [Burkholderiaceae bacterium]